MQMYWPVIMVVASNMFYHIFAKQTPQGLNAFFSLSISYFVGLAISLILFFVTSPEKNLVAEMGKLNWVPFAFGLCIIGLEFGNLNIYRLGWKISVAPLVCNISLALVLLVVGALLYKEVISLRQIAGVAACVVGLVLITG